MLDKPLEDILRIRLKNSSFCNKGNIFIGCAYISPKNSSYVKQNKCNILDKLRRQLTGFSSKDSILIRADFHSRVGTLPDLLREEEKDLDFLSENYE